MSARKRSCLPHSSYDLDGDGWVGQKDMIISKLYDMDKDGKLNATEKKAALTAIENVRLYFITWHCFRESIITSFGTSTKLEVINHIELCRSVARLSLPKTSMTCRTRTPSTPSPRTSPTAKASISWGMCASKTYWASLKKTIQTTENLQFSKNTSLPTWKGTVTTLNSLQSKLASTPKRSHPASRQAWLRRARTQNNKLNNLR